MNVRNSQSGKSRWYIYVNCLNRLRILAEVSTKFQKMHSFVDNLRTITEERNMETRQVTPLFICFFSSNCL